MPTTYDDTIFQNVPSSSDLKSYLEWINSLNTGLRDGSVDPLKAQGFLTNSNLDMSPSFEKFLDNLIAKQNTQEARDWENQMASTDLIRSASQLNQLGLSSNNVLTTGGSSVNAVDTASSVKTNMAEQRLDRNNQIARSMISMASAMAHAGITGGSIGLVKNVASGLAAKTAHSAQAVSNEVWRQRFIKAGLEQQWNEKYANK